MKTLFLALSAFLFSSPVFAAPVLFCGYEYQSLTQDDDVNVHLAIYGEATFKCSTISVSLAQQPGGFAVGVEKTFTATIQGYGIGLHVAAASAFTITCPNVRGKALGEASYVTKNGNTRKGATDFYGLRVEAGALVGAQVGVFSNRRGGVCFVTGVDAGVIGAAIQGAKLTIEKDNY